MCWYRDFAERTGNPMIREARLHKAEDLEAEAGRLEHRDSQNIGARAAR